MTFRPLAFEDIVSPKSSGKKVYDFGEIKKARGGADKYVEMVRAEAEAQGVDPDWAESIHRLEYSPRSWTSPKGAVGPMQVMPNTFAEVAQELGIENPDINNPEHNIRAGVHYLRKMEGMFGDRAKASAAYNMGPGGLRLYLEGKRSMPKETSNYLAKLGMELPASQERYSTTNFQPLSFEDILGTVEQVEKVEKEVRANRLREYLGGVGKWVENTLQIEPDLNLAKEDMKNAMVWFDPYVRSGAMKEEDISSAFSGLEPSQEDFKNVIKHMRELVPYQEMPAHKMSPHRLGPKDLAAAMEGREGVELSGTPIPLPIPGLGTFPMAVDFTTPKDRESVLEWAAAPTDMPKSTGDFISRVLPTSAAKFFPNLMNFLLHVASIVPEAIKLAIKDMEEFDTSVPVEKMEEYAGQWESALYGKVGGALWDFTKEIAHFMGAVTGVNWTLDSILGREGAGKEEFMQMWLTDPVMSLAALSPFLRAGRAFKRRMEKAGDIDITELYEAVKKEADPAELVKAKMYEMRNASDYYNWREQELSTMRPFAKDSDAVQWRDRELRMMKAAAKASEEATPAYNYLQNLKSDASQSFKDMMGKEGEKLSGRARALAEAEYLEWLDSMEAEGVSKMETTKPPKKPAKVQTAKEKVVKEKVEEPLRKVKDEKRLATKEATEVEKKVADMPDKPLTPDERALVSPEMVKPNIREALTLEETVALEEIFTHRGVLKKVLGGEDLALQLDYFQYLANRWRFGDTSVGIESVKGQVNNIRRRYLNPDTTYPNKEQLSARANSLYEFIATIEQADIPPSERLLPDGMSTGSRQKVKPPQLTPDELVVKEALIQEAKKVESAELPPSNIPLRKKVKGREGGEEAVIKVRKKNKDVTLRAGIGPDELMAEFKRLTEYYVKKGYQREAATNVALKETADLFIKSVTDSVEAKHTKMRQSAEEMAAVKKEARKKKAKDVEKGKVEPTVEVVDRNPFGDKIPNSIYELIEMTEQLKNPPPKEVLAKLKEKSVRMWVDTKGNIKQELKNYDKYGVEGYRVWQMLINIGGASTFTKDRFNALSKSIYGGLNKNQEKALNGLIYARRRMAIDEAHASKSGYQHSFNLGTEAALAFEKNLKSLYNLTDAEVSMIMGKTEQYFNTMRGELKRLLDNGLVSEAQYEKLVRFDYTRSQLVEQIDPFREHVVPVGEKPIRSSGIEYLKAGDFFDVLETDSRLLLAEAVARVDGRIRYNELNVAMADLAKAHPQNGIAMAISSPKKGPRDWPLIDYYVKGKRHYFKLDPRWGKEWVKHRAEISSTMAQFLRVASVSVPLRLSATGLNLAFAIAQFPMDFIDAWYKAGTYVEGKRQSVYSPHAPIGWSQLSKDLATTASDVWLRKGLLEKFREEGLGMEFLTMQGRVMHSGPRIKTRENAWDFVEKTVGYLGITMETWTRVAVANRVYTEALKKGMPEKMAVREAVTAARDFRDYYQGGWATKAVDQAIPYTNASVQGMRTFLREWKENPKDALLKTAWLGSTAMSFLIANEYYYPGEIDKINHQIAGNNFMLATPLTFTDEYGEERRLFFRIPKDHSQRGLLSIYEQFARMAMGREVNLKQVQSALSAGVPNEVMPPILNAIAAYFGNLDTNGWERIWKGQELAKASGEYTKRTGKPWIDIGEATGASPERLRVAMGKFVTSNNPAAWVAGGLWESFSEDLPNDITNRHWAMVLRDMPISGRWLYLTSEYLKDADFIDDAKMEAQLIRHIENTQLDMLAEGALYNGKADVEDVIEFITSTNDPDTVDRLLERWTMQVVLKESGLQNKRWWLEFQNAVPEVRAKMLRRAMENPDPKHQENLATGLSLFDSLLTDQVLKHFSMGMVEDQ